MDTLPLSFRSVPELRVAADTGHALYSCERVEDAYGRLLIGVGALLPHRELDAVRQQGRSGLAASPVALGDGPALRTAVERATRPRPKDNMTLEAGVREALDRLRTICPQTAAAATSVGPGRAALAHGIRVGSEATRIVDACNRLQEASVNGPLRPYPLRLRQEVFAAGVVHDIGMWEGGTRTRHPERGAELLRRSTSGKVALSTRLETKARMVALHHALEALVRMSGDDPWERQRALPLAMAEAIVESDDGGAAAIARLVSGEMSGVGKVVLVAACEVAGVVPERAIVRRSVGGRAEELAVCLSADPLCLLRFARRREDGDYYPLFRLDADVEDAREYLADGEEGEKRVVAILGGEEYKRRFEAYKAVQISK